MEEEQTPNKEQQEIINKVTQGKNLGFFDKRKISKDPILQEEIYSNIREKVDKGQELNKTEQETYQTIINEFQRILKIAKKQVQETIKNIDKEVIDKDKLIEQILSLKDTVDLIDDKGNEVTEEWLNTKTTEELMKDLATALEFAEKEVGIKNENKP